MLLDEIKKYYSYLEKPNSPPSLTDTLDVAVGTALLEFPFLCSMC